MHSSRVGASKASRLGKSQTTGPFGLKHKVLLTLQTEWECVIRLVVWPKKLLGTFEAYWLYWASKEKKLAFKASKRGRTGYTGSFREAKGY